MRVESRVSIPSTRKSDKHFSSVSLPISLTLGRNMTLTMVPHSCFECRVSIVGDAWKLARWLPSQEVCCVTFSFLQQIFASLPRNPQRLSLSIWRVSWLLIPAPWSWLHQSWQLSIRTQALPSSQSWPASVLLPLRPSVRECRTSRMICGNMLSGHPGRVVRQV